MNVKAYEGNRKYGDVEKDGDEKDCEKVVVDASLAYLACLPCLPLPACLACLLAACLLACPPACLLARLPAFLLAYLLSCLLAGWLAGWLACQCGSPGAPPQTSGAWIAQTSA